MARLRQCLRSRHGRGAPRQYRRRFRAGNVVYQPGPGIAPLWPVDDAVAAQLAIDFYRALLLERLSLGESLHRAKLLAKQDLANAEAVRGGLSWASVVLYGDPTPRLLQSLWTPSAQRQKQPTAILQPAGRATRPSKERIRGRRLAQATEDEARRLVSGPGMQATAWSAARGAEEALPTDQPVFELVEVNGIRFWQIIDPHNGRRRALPGSELAALACNDTVRGALGLQRGWKDYVKVLGRWVADKVTGGDNRPLLMRLAEQYDRDTVEKEQLLWIGADLDLAPLGPAPWNWLGGPLIPGQEDRVLLIIHGTFSKTAAPVDGLGKEFLQWAGTRYRGVIGLDHWTLSKTPEDNARMLWDLLDASGSLIVRKSWRIEIGSSSGGFSSQISL